MSKSSDEFLTPPSLVALAKAVLDGPIDFDPYSSPGQLVPARDGLTLASDPEPWPTHGNWWANIPFSDSATVLPRLAQHFARAAQITALVLCLAAPSSVYWRHAVWSKKVGPRRIAWMPRLSFYRLDGAGKAVPTKDSISRDICMLLWTEDARIVSRFERLVPEFSPPSRTGKVSKRDSAPICLSSGGRP